MKIDGGIDMRHSNTNLAYGTNGNPNQELEQFETEIKSKELEFNLLKNNRDRMLDSVKTEKAKKIISELYRPGATVGDGGTADMLRDEAVNGVQPGKKSHYQKASDRVREINKVLSNNQAPGDEEVLRNEKEKLEKAIKLWENKNGKK